MLIGELVKKTGLSRDTIRFYEKQGLIEVDRKHRRDNNYKEYSETHLQRLFLIKKIKSFGFTLNEVAELVDMIEMNEATCSTVSSKVAEKIGVIDTKIKELLAIRDLMLDLAGNKDACCTPHVEDQNCPALVSGM